MKRVLLIANADAGGDDEASIDQAAEILQAAGTAVEIARSDSREALDAALDRRDGRDLVAAGGDGTLHAVVAALARRDELTGPTVGLIPMGTGNDFARAVGIPLEPPAAAAAIARSTPVPVDLLIDDEGGVVVNAVHLGVGVEAARRAAAWKPRLGRLAYGLGALVAGLRTNGVRVRVEADDVVIADGSKPVLQVGVGNGPFVGGGAALMPRAVPTDHCVDVMVSFALPAARRLRYAAQVRRGSHPRRADVVTKRASVVRVSGSAFWCTADGELTGPHLSRTWTLRAAAFTMALPDREPA